MKTADEYCGTDTQSHAYDNSSMWIGNDTTLEREEYVFTAGRINKQKINTPTGVEQLFTEIIRNAMDAARDSKRRGYPNPEINIKLTNKVVRIKNYGFAIPIEENLQGMLIPTFLFTVMFTSSNYKKDRIDSGNYGCGSKLARIYSKWLRLKVNNREQGRYYEKTWYGKDDTSHGDETVTKNKDKRSSVSVAYEINFERFNYTIPTYSEQDLSLFTKIILDIAMTSGINIILNKSTINVKSVIDYAALIFPAPVMATAIDYSDKEGQIVLLDYPKNVVISFVNGVNVKDGGVHITVINNQVCNFIKKKLNNKNDTTKKPLTNADIKSKYSFICSFWLVNPKLKGQTKSYLESPKPTIDLSSKLPLLQQWNMWQRLINVGTEFKKINRNKKKHIKLEKAEDANLAGTSESSKCVLCVTEGTSGSDHFEMLVANIPRGNDYYGILPLKGKFLNVRKASDLQKNKNKEIEELNNVLNLVKGVDYSDDNNLSTLRYGALWVMADSDVDGKHIVGLILNYFHYYFPELLARGFVHYYVTPIIKVSYGSEKYSFYTIGMYNAWKERNPNHERWITQYFKGLGSSSEEDVLENYRNLRIVKIMGNDLEITNIINFMFDKNSTDLRKEWLLTSKPFQGKELINKCTVREFVDNELIDYCHAGNKRSIPKLIDSLKECQRKIIFAMFKKWKVEIGKNYTKYKVGQFAHFVAACTNYHHNENVLSTTIVRMAQYFPGINNIPWFTRESCFGSRNKGGTNAAKSRYLFTTPEKVIPYIIRKEDDPLLEYIVDEGNSIEPKHYYPIIPIILANGSIGLGIGFSVFIPQYNPITIIDWIMAKLYNTKLPKMVPWYHGFTGEIKLDGNKMTSYGRMSVTTGKKRVVTITELPIGIWTRKYYTNVIGELLKQKAIADCNNHSKRNGKINIEVILKPGTKEDEINWQLSNTVDLGNICLLDEEGIPRKYSSVIEVLETFFTKRYAIYQKRVELLKGIIEKRIAVAKEKLRLILLFKNNKDLLDLPLSEIKVVLGKNNISYAAYKGMMVCSFPDKKVEKLKQAIASDEEKLAKYDLVGISEIWCKELSELKSFLQNNPF